MGSIRTLYFEDNSLEEWEAFLKATEIPKNASISAQLISPVFKIDTQKEYEQKIQEFYSNATILPVIKNSESESMALYLHYSEKNKINSLNELAYHLSLKNLEQRSEITKKRKDFIDYARIDYLTGLPNLYTLRHDIDEHNSSSLVVINIDNFKIINDFYGFVVGDVVLEKMAKKLKEITSPYKVYRIAGDEFALITDEKLDFYELKIFMEKLSEKLQSINFNYYDIEICFDCTLASSASTDNSEIFSKVNMALKYAKDNRRSFWIYEEHMELGKEYENNLKIARKIRSAIKRSDIVPYFQPIVCNSTGKTVKYECLSRLIDEKENVISPLEFIPISRTLRLYSHVTKTIIEKSFDAFKNSPYGFSINISVEDILHKKIYKYILEKLKESKIGNRVVFEILESENINDYAPISRFIAEVKRYGAKIAIDDFGSGFANFSYLTKIDADYIKIDGSLIENIDCDNSALTITKTIVSFAKEMGIKTVAEFVHSSSVLAIVKEIGIDYSQGYYFDRPLSEIR